jgi:hypothetical protein
MSMTELEAPNRRSICDRPGTVERAFELARGGKDLKEIRRALAAERYEDAQPQLTSPALIAHLRRLAKGAQREQPD